MTIRDQLLAAGWDGRSRDILDIEAALTAADIPFRRWCELEDPAGGWVFEVDGERVATGGAIGVLEGEVWQWLRA